MSVLNQSGEDAVECPLCMEPLEVDDLNFFPCTCGYQICRFCWHRIRTDENGLCPACRKAYSENPADFKPLTKEEIARYLWVCCSAKLILVAIWFNHDLTILLPTIDLSRSALFQIKSWEEVEGSTTEAESYRKSETSSKCESSTKKFSVCSRITNAAGRCWCEYGQ